MNVFNNGRDVNHLKLFPYRLKVSLRSYGQEMEDFCHDNFGEKWGIRYLNQLHMPQPTFRKGLSSSQSYIMCFANEEDAVFFKMNYPDTEALSEYEVTADMRN